MALKRTLYVIDNSNFCYKFKSVYTYAHTDVSGIELDTSVLVGYLRALKQNIATDICIVLDGVPKASLDLLPSYKGHRSKEDSNTIGVPRLEVIHFLTGIGKILNKNIFVVCAPCQEADQVISSIVHLITGNTPRRKSLLDTVNTIPLNQDRVLRYLDGNVTVEKPDFSDYDSVIIGTTDSDMHQLLRYDNVFMDSSTSGKAVYRDKTPKAVHHLNPNAMIIYKAIFGDDSDNVPALSLKNKEAIIKWLDKNITTRDDVDRFIEDVDNGLKYNSLTQAIITSGQKRGFMRNLAVVKLDYYSEPIMVTCPSYNVLETIEKYGLKV